MLPIFYYEEHYMWLMKNYRHEIEFINNLHTTHTQEVKNFYGSELPVIIKKLKSEPIADDVRRGWLKHHDSNIPLATRREVLKNFLRWYQKFVEAWGYESADAFFLIKSKRTG